MKLGKLFHIGVLYTIMSKVNIMMNKFDHLEERKKLKFDWRTRIARIARAWGDKFQRK